MIFTPGATLERDTTSVRADTTPARKRVIGIGRDDKTPTRGRGIGIERAIQHLKELVNLLQHQL